MSASFRARALGGLALLAFLSRAMPLAAQNEPAQKPFKTEEIEQIVAPIAVPRSRSHACWVLAPIRSASAASIGVVAIEIEITSVARAKPWGVRMPAATAAPSRTKPNSPA